MHDVWVGLIKAPFFAVIKPTIETGFDYKQMMWDKAAAETGKTRKSSACRTASGAWPGLRPIDAQTKKKPPEGGLLSAATCQ